MNNKTTKELVAEMSKLHQEINKNNLYISEEEKKAQIIFMRCNAVIMNLITEQHCNIRGIELSLFYFFHQLFVKQCELDDAENTPIEIVYPAASAIMANIAKNMPAVGKDNNFNQMADIISRLSEELPDYSLPENCQIPPEEVQIINETIMHFINHAIRDELHPVLVRNALLYHWFRVSTLVAKSPEEIFQRIEQNWGDVIQLFDDAYYEFVESET